jgi:hypothetical protein
VPERTGFVPPVWFGWLPHETGMEPVLGAAVYSPASLS